MGYNLVVDIEGNNLYRDITEVHCICCIDIATKEIRVYYDDLKYPDLWDTIKFAYPQASFCGPMEDAIPYLNEADMIAGHNWKGYDEEVLKDFFPDYKPKGLILDTFTASCLMFPEYYSRNSLESFTERLGLPVSKIQVDDWSHLHINMLIRCIHDIMINDMVLAHLYQIACHDEDKFGVDWMDAFMIEGEVSRVHCHQTDFGVWFDQEKARGLIDKWDLELDRMEASVVSKAPLKAKKKGVEVKDPFLKSGKYSKMVTDWFEDDEYGWIGSVCGPFSRIEWIPLNINSHQQVKDFLFTLGWVPTTYNSKKTSEGGFKRTSPKLTEDSFESLPDGLGQELANYFVLSHRRNILENRKDPDKKGAFAKLRADGRIPAEAMTCATPTSRFRHSGVIVNLPSPGAPYGAELRECFGSGPEENDFFVGVDLSGIEARMLAHFCFPFEGGPEFAEMVLHGDWHSVNKGIWGVPRNIAKNCLYALMYGAGDAKLGGMAGKNKKAGGKMKSDFFEANPAYADLISNLEAEYMTMGGFIKGIDGRKFFVRNKKDLLNTYLQGNSAIIFKHWLVGIDVWAGENLRDKTEVCQQVIAYHDEVEYYVKGDESYAHDLLCYAEGYAPRVGVKFRLNVELAAAGAIGFNWKHVH